ncbi:hypothetical protein NLG97_g4396 [Lecanicillium saksenae]|uniref:Uncharacterized protein n=1 Tax=Lecanicillium saksenae TaxID=468837 RepID=A0ACC1QX25_9HYPO|nr:hypothetical protein NLG97_g4396 [Lecanicillium saksenae]
MDTIKVPSGVVAHAEAYIATLAVCLAFFIGMFIYMVVTGGKKSETIEKLQSKIRRLESVPALMENGNSTINMFRNHTSTSNQTYFNNTTAPIKRTNHDIYIAMERVSYHRRDDGNQPNLAWAAVGACALMLLIGILICVCHHRQEKSADRHERNMRRIQGVSSDDDGFELQPVTGGRPMPRRPPPTYSRR